MTNGAYNRHQKSLRHAQEAWDNVSDKDYEDWMMNEPQGEEDDDSNRD